MSIRLKRHLASFVSCKVGNHDVSQQDTCRAVLSKRRSVGNGKCGVFVHLRQASHVPQYHSQQTKKRSIIVTYIPNESVSIGRGRNRRIATKHKKNR